MKKLVLPIAIALSFAGAAQAQATKTVTVAMHDPGCHSFVANGKYLTKLSVSGPVRLANYDENTLIVKGKSGIVLVKIGKSSAPLAKGVYHITMVHQAPDDNHLVLTVT
jgi:hypothetical protein